MNAEPNGSTCQWQHGLYPEILTLISDLLPLSDFISFRATCRVWRAAPSHRSNITLFSKFHVWTISYDLADDHLCPVYDMKSNSSCLLRLPSLRHSTCIISKHGWLLFVRDGDPSHFFFYNPFSLQEIPLPPYPNPPPELVEMIGEFSSRPTSPNCFAFVVSSRGASTLEMARVKVGVGQAEWEIHKVNIEMLEKNGLRWRDLHYCNCAEDGSCACTRKNLLYVMEFDSCIAFNMDKRLGAITHRSKPSMSLSLGNLVDNHWMDWRRRFGNELILSFPKFSSKNACFARHRSLMATTPEELAAAKGVITVKTVFIEPIFPWLRHLGRRREEGEGVGCT